jgi:hypothetical protein
MQLLSRFSVVWSTIGKAPEKASLNLEVGTMRERTGPRAIDMIIPYGFLVFHPSLRPSGMKISLIILIALCWILRASASSDCSQYQIRRVADRSIPTDTSNADSQCITLQAILCRLKSSKDISNVHHPLGHIVRRIEVELETKKRSIKSFLFEITEFIRTSIRF